MNDKIASKSKQIFTTAEVIVLVIMTLIIGLTIGRITSNKTIKLSSVTKDTYLNEFINNYEYITKNYYEEIDREQLINNAISGMMNSLDDPYSIYLDEESSNTFSITLDGSYQGIGIQIFKNPETSYMQITAIFKNSPAAVAGLQIGDEIISANTILAKDMTASEFSLAIKESTDNDFNLNILREGKKITINLSKELVTLDSVTSKNYQSVGKNIGYIYIGIFANNTYEQFKEQLHQLETTNIDYLIIDVRGNTGGHLTAVDSILDLFLTSKYKLYGFDQAGKITYTYGEGKEDKKYKIILLGNGESASASEVLISSLKENLAAIFIGQKTYGKGTVQELVTLSDGNQYKITTKKWITPKGNCVNDTKGIVPDIEVALDDKYYELSTDENDSQLQRVLEYIDENKQ